MEDYELKQNSQSYKIRHYVKLRQPSKAEIKRLEREAENEIRRKKHSGDISWRFENILYGEDFRG